MNARLLQQAIRNRYTWYLHPPFKAKFDRSHWWDEHPYTGPEAAPYEPEAALYELARRHPLVAEKTPINATLPGSEPLIPLPSIFGPKPSLLWTRRLAMRSWVKLTKSEQSAWKSHMGKSKGLDLRPPDSLCRNITGLAHSAIIQQRADQQRTWAENLTGPYSGLGWLPGRTSPTDREWEAAIAQCAIEAHRQGYRLLAVAPDMAAHKAQSVLLKEYQEQLRLYPSAKAIQRARWQDWLPLISKCEDAEAGGDKQREQVFVRYRRVVDAIRFT
jgi:hypothetical protein